MPVQVQTSTLAQKLGQRIVQAHNTHKDKPVDKGQVRLPAGIRGGKARLNAMYISQYKDGEFKGQDFFRASGIVVHPTTHNGQTIAGSITSVMVPLCDQPAKGKRKAKSFLDNWADFQNYFQLLGVNPPDVDGVPEAQRPQAIMNYYDAAMKMLCGNPNSAKPEEKLGKRPHFEFSTRGWTPPAVPGQPPPTEMVFEEWHGLTEFNGVADPGAGVTEHQPGNNGDTTALQPEPFTEPPMGVQETPTVEEPATESGEEPSQEDIIMALVEVANGDPDNATEEGAGAKQQLEEYAIAAGATKEQVTNAVNWEEVAAMALGNLPEADAGGDPKVGDARKFKKRDSKGNPLANVKDKKPFPAIDIEIVSVDAKNKTVTAKDKAGKVVTAIGGKTPLAIKWEWLE